MSRDRADWLEASPAAVVDYLESISYPCSKAEILHHVARRGAPQTVIDVLQRLPEEQYYDLAHVMDRFSRVSP